MKKGKNKFSFTMIELMVSIVILSVGLVAILRSVGLTVFSLNHAQNQYYAAQIIRAKIEEAEEIIMKGIDEEELNGEEKISHQGKKFNVTVEVVSKNIELEEFPQKFSNNEDIEEIPQISDELYEIKTTAQWQEQGRDQQLVMETYFLNNQ